MKQYILNIFTVAFIFLVIGCTKADEESPVFVNGLDDGRFISKTVSDKGGTISVTFTTNTDWKLETRSSNVEIMPESGKKGENTVAITIPQNMSPYDRQYEFYLSLSYDSSSWVNFTSFAIKQDKAPLLELPDTIEFGQSATTKVVDVRANGLYSVEIPEKDTSWLSYFIDESMHLNLSATQNQSIESRTAVMILTLGSLQKNVTITQKGGIIFDSSMIDQENGDTIGMDLIQYNIPPTGGNYLLYVSSNAKFEWTQSEQEDGITVEEISKNDFIATYSITTEKIGEDENAKRFLLHFQFENNKKKEITIYQNSWNLILTVNRGERLSEKIKEVQDKVEQGYKITSLYIDHGDIDINSVPSTLRSINIKNVAKIPDYFCRGCRNIESAYISNVDAVPYEFCNSGSLTNLSLSNVKKIGERAFYNTSIKYIEIPSTVTYIGDAAFQIQIKYPYVTCYSSTPPTIGTHVFQSGMGSGTLKVPMGSKPKYKASYNWNSQFLEIREF